MTFYKEVERKRLFGSLVLKPLDTVCRYRQFDTLPLLSTLGKTNSATLKNLLLKFAEILMAEGGVVVASCQPMPYRIWFTKRESDSTTTLLKGSPKCCVTTSWCKSPNLSYNLGEGVHDTMYGSGKHISDWNYSATPTFLPSSCWRPCFSPSMSEATNTL